jgi:hypothetical protein
MKLVSKQALIRSKRAGRIAVAGAALLFAALAPALASAQGVVPAAAATGTCQPAVVTFSASPMSGGDRATTSRTFVVIPEASIGFIQRGTGPSCVVVEFSAVVFAPGASRMNIRALLDDTTTAQPGEITFAANDNAAAPQDQAHAFNFIFPLIEPGRHAVRMQYRSVTGAAVRMGRHSTIVHSAP